MLVVQSASERERERGAMSGMMMWTMGGTNGNGDGKKKVMLMESLYGKGGMYAGGSGVIAATMRMKSGVDAAAQNMLVPSVAEAELKKQTKFGTCDDSRKIIMRS